MKALIFNIQKFCLHDGRGIRTTIFFKGCNLRCAWCANPESQSCQPETLDGTVTGRYYALEEIMEEVLKDKPFYDKSGGGVTLSGGEPLMQADFVLALCDALHAAGITVGLETAACAPEQIFAEVLKKCDFAQIDLKHWSDEKHRQGTGVGFDLILSNIRHALSLNIQVILRIPVIPGYNDSTGDAKEFARLLRELGATEVQVLPFHQLGEKKYANLNKPYAYSGVPQLHNGDLSAFAETLSSAGLLVQIGG
jgi:pyruvate formate lyase activating enzyme